MAMQYQIRIKTVEEFLAAFPIQMEEIDKVIGRPTFIEANKVIKAIKTNCIAMYDARSPALGKLHCITNSQHLELEVGGVAVPPSVNPGPPSFIGLADAAARDIYIVRHTQQRALWKADQNVKEACKRFLLSRFELVYLQELSHPLTRFKWVTIEQMIDHIETNYPVEPEDIELQEALLREDWDANNRIENLFERVGKGCKTLRDMNAIDLAEMDKTFIKYVYRAIRGSGQFELACFKWKALPAADRDTEEQIRTFFSKKYEIYDAQQNSLHNAGVTNSSVRLQERRQATRDISTNIRDRQDEQKSINDTLLQMVKSKISDADDTFSAMTAHTVVQQQRINELEAQIRALSNTRIDNSGSGSRGGGSSLRGSSNRGAGRGNTGGRGNRVHRPWSDGPAHCTKTGKYYPNDNYCWSHGYDCAINHDSKSCNRKANGHQESAAGDNPMGGSMKDKEFSKWKNNELRSIPQNIIL
jgi:hypothetical protein